MSLRIPLSPDLTLQTEFHEIERRLRKLERATGATVGTTTLRVVGGSGTAQVDLKPILDRLDLLEQLVADLGTPAAEIQDFGAVGPTAIRGLVPSPGTSNPPTGTGGHVLVEDGEWGFPLRGLIGVATSGEQSDPAEDVVDVSAGLHVSGNLSASHVTANDVIVLGYLKPNGVLCCSEYELSLAGLV